MAKDITDRIKDVLAQIDTEEREKARLEGRRETLMAQLKELGCDSLEAAREELEKLKEDIKGAETVMNSILTELEETYGKA